MQEHATQGLFIIWPLGTSSSRGGSLQEQQGVWGRGCGLHRRDQSLEVELESGGWLLCLKPGLDLLPLATEELQNPRTRVLCSVVLACNQTGMMLLWGTWLEA